MSKLTMSTVQKRISNILATEKSFYNSDVSVSILHFSTYAFVFFAIFLSFINYLSIEIIQQTEYYIRFSISILLALIVENIIYFILVRFFLGLDFGLIMLHTAYCYLINTITGYCFFMCLYNWVLDGYIVYDLDYRHILDRIIQNAISVALIVLAIYLLVIIIGAIKDRIVSPNIWRVGVVLPLIALLVSSLMVLFIRSSQLYDYSVVVTQFYFMAVMYLIARYIAQFLFYILIKSNILERLERRKEVVEKVDSKYFGKVMTIEQKYQNSLSMVGNQFKTVKSKSGSIVSEMGKKVEGINLGSQPNKEKKQSDNNDKPLVIKPIEKIDLKIEVKPTEQKQGEKKTEEKKSDGEKPTETKAEEKKTDELKPAIAKIEEIKPTEQKTDGEKPIETKIEEKKTDELKPAIAKIEEMKPTEQKADGEKPTETKTEEKKTDELKPTVAKIEEIKPTELKPVETKNEIPTMAIQPTIFDDIEKINQTNQDQNKTENNN